MLPFNILTMNYQKEKSRKQPHLLSHPGGNAGEVTPEPALRQERGLDEAPTLGGQGEPAGICKTRARE